MARRVITAREQHELAEPFLRLAAEEPLADWEKELMAGAEPEVAQPPGITGDIIQKQYPELPDYTLASMAEDWSHGGDLAAQQQHAHEHLTKLTTPGHSFYSPKPGGHADKWKAIHEDAFGEPWTGEVEHSEKAKSIAENAADAFAGAGFKVKTQDEFFKDHAPPGSGPQAKDSPKPYQGYLNEFLDKANSPNWFGNDPDDEWTAETEAIKTPAFGEWFTKKYPNGTDNGEPLYPDVVAGQYLKEKGSGSKSSDDDYDQIQELLKPVTTPPPATTPDLSGMEENLQNFFRTDADEGSQYGDLADNEHFKDWFNDNYPDFGHGDMFPSDVVSEYETPWNTHTYYDQPQWMQNMSYGSDADNEIYDWQKEVGAEQIHNWKEDYDGGGLQAINSFHEYLDNKGIDHPDDLDVAMYTSQDVDTTEEEYKYWKNQLPDGAESYFADYPTQGGYDYTEWKDYYNGETLHHKSNCPQGPNTVNYEQMYSDQSQNASPPESLTSGYDSFVPGFKAYMLTQYPALEQYQVNKFDGDEWSALEQGWNNLSSSDQYKLINLEGNKLHPNQPDEEFAPTEATQASTPTPVPSGPVVPFATPFPTNQHGMPVNLAGYKALANTIWGSSVGQDLKDQWIETQMAGHASSATAHKYLKDNYPQQWKNWQTKQGGAQPAAAPQDPSDVTPQMVIDHLVNQPGSNWQWNPQNHSGSSGGLLDLPGMSPDQIKATLEAWASSTTMTAPTVAQAKKTLDALFGSGAQPQETASGTFHQQLVTSPEFKAWFKKDNSFDLDKDDKDGSLRKMLLDSTNDWTMSKLIQFKNAQDKVKPSQGSKEFGTDAFAQDYKNAFPGTSYTKSNFGSPMAAQNILQNIIGEDVSDGVGHYDGDDDFDRGDDGPNFPDYSEYQDAVDEWQQEKDKAQDLYDKYFGDGGGLDDQGAPGYDFGQDEAANQYGQLLNDQPFYNWVTGKTGEVNSMAQMFYQKYPQYALDAWEAKQGQGGAGGGGLTPEIIKQHFPNIGPTSLAGWLLDGDPAKQKQKIVNHLNYLTDEKPGQHEETKAKWKIILDKAFGGATAPAAFDAVQAATEYGNILGIGSEINSHGVYYKDLSYDDFKNKLAKKIQEAKDGDPYYAPHLDKFQALYNKYFGQSQGYTPQGPVDLGSSAPLKIPVDPFGTPDSLMSGDDLNPDFEKWLWASMAPGISPENFLTAIQGWTPEHWTMAGNAFLGKNQPAAAAVAGGYSPDYDGPPVEWLAKNYPTSHSNGFYDTNSGSHIPWSPEAIQKWWSGTGKDSPAGQKWTSNAHGDKADFSTPAFSSAVKITPSQVERIFATIANESGADPKLPSGAPLAEQLAALKQIQSNWASGNPYADASQQTGLNTLIKSIQNTLNDGASAPAAQGAANFDAMAFAQDAAAAFGGDPDLANDDDKKFKDMTYDEAKTSIAQGAGGDWGGDKAKWQAVYDKYFGEGATAPAGPAPLVSADSQANKSLVENVYQPEGVAAGGHDYDKIGQLAKQMSFSGGPGRYATNFADWMLWAHGLDSGQLAAFIGNPQKANASFDKFLESAGLGSDEYSQMRNWAEKKFGDTQIFHDASKKPQEFGKLYDQWKQETSGGDLGTFTEEPETPAVGTTSIPDWITTSDGGKKYFPNGPQEYPGFALFFSDLKEAGKSGGIQNALDLWQKLSQNLKDAYTEKATGNQTPVPVPTKPNFYDQFQAIVGHDPDKVEKNKQLIAEKGVDWVKSEIKKRLKVEQDPEKFVKLVDLWQKNFGGPTGSGAITPLLKKLKPGQPLNQAAMMALWQLKDTGELPDWIKNAPADTSGDLWPTYDEQDDPLGSGSTSADTTPQPPTEYDKVAFSKEVAKFLSSNGHTEDPGDWDYGLGAYAKLALKNKIKNFQDKGLKNSVAALQKIYDKWFGADPAPDASEIPDTLGEAVYWATPKLSSDFFSSTGLYSDNTDEIKKKALQTHINGSIFDDATKAKLQQVHDKFFGDNAAPQSGGMTFDEMKAKIKAADPGYWNNSSHNNKFNNWTEKDWLNQLHTMVANSIDNSSAFKAGEIDTYKEIIKQFEGGGPAPAQSGTGGTYPSGLPGGTAPYDKAEVLKWLKIADPDHWNSAYNNPEGMKNSLKSMLKSGEDYIAANGEGSYTNKEMQIYKDLIAKYMSAPQSAPTPKPSAKGFDEDFILQKLQEADSDFWHDDRLQELRDKDWDIKGWKKYVQGWQDNGQGGNYSDTEMKCYEDILDHLDNPSSSAGSPAGFGNAAPDQQYPPGMSSWGGGGGSAPAASMSDIVRGQLSTMVDKLRAPESEGIYNEDDIRVARSPEFQQWFRDAPAPYRQTTSQFPSMALEDYAKGGEYGWVPESTGDIARVYDPYSYPAKGSGKGGWVTTPSGERLRLPGYGDKQWPGYTFNPESTSSARPPTKFPNRPPDVPGQLEIPLPDGSSWVPDKKFPELRRGISVEFNRYEPGNADHKLLTKPGIVGERHRAAARLMREIKELMVGPQPGRNDSSSDDYEKALNAGTNFFDPPWTLFDSETQGTDFVDAPPKPSKYDPDGWLEWLSFAQKNNVPPEQMWDLAKSVGSQNPDKYGTPPQSYLIAQSHRDPAPMAKEISRLIGEEFTATDLSTVSKKLKRIRDNSDRDGDYDQKTRNRAEDLYDKYFGQGFVDDLLAHKILEYIETGAYKPSDYKDHPSVGGMGSHWTTKDSTDFGSGRSADESGFPLEVIIDWPGAGEDPDRKDAAWNYHSEKEISLNPGTPVIVKRIRFKHPKHGDSEGSYDRSRWITHEFTPHKRHASIAPRRQGRAILSHRERFAADDDPGADFDVWPGPYADRTINHGQPTSLRTPRYDEHTRPVLDNGEHYFSPYEVNPPSNAASRPDIHWVGHEPEQDVLPDIDFPEEVAPGMPIDRHAQPLFRGLSLDLTHPDAAEIHRMVYGHHPDDHHMFDLGHEPQPRYDHPELARAILDHLEHSRQPTHGLGRHWSVDPSEAHGFAISQAQSLLNDPDSIQLPVRLRADWKGAGENPYRHETGESHGEFADEMEMNILPGADMNVGDVQIRHPDLHRWVSLNHQPEHRHAQHATVRPRSAKRILTHREMMEG